jgi:hypothetical protein
MVRNGTPRKQICLAKCRQAYIPALRRAKRPVAARWLEFSQQAMEEPKSKNPSPESKRSEQVRAPVKGERSSSEISAEQSGATMVPDSAAAYCCRQRQTLRSSRTVGQETETSSSERSRTAASPIFFALLLTLGLGYKALPRPFYG